jgi:uncharacterized alpha-E superfamily protein
VKYFMLLPDMTAVGSALDLVQWASVLRSCSAFEAFRRARRGELALVRVVDYLLRDEFSPRSVRFSVLEVEQALGHIAHQLRGPAVETARAATARLRADLEAADTQVIIAAGLHEYLDHVQLRLMEVHAAVQAAFIHYAVPPERVA